MLERVVEFHMVSRMTGNGLSTQEGDEGRDQVKYDGEYSGHSPSPQPWIQIKENRVGPYLLSANDDLGMMINILRVIY